LRVLAAARVALAASWDVAISAMAGKKPGVGTAVAKPEPEPETAPAADAAAAAEVAPKPRFDRRKLIMVGAPLLVAGLGAGLWFTGVLPHLLGLSRDAKQAADAAASMAPVFVDLPEMVANLDSNPHRPSYVKLVARLELGSPADAARVQQAMPRLQDLFQTYLREMHPDELRGAAGTYRLREELIARAAVAAAPAMIKDVLFTELLVQ
jgi:flagellar FliL protein